MTNSPSRIFSASLSCSTFLSSSFLVAMLFGAILVCPVTAQNHHRGQDLMKLLPEISRNADIETPESFFGFPIGSRHLRHDEVTAYLRSLAESSERATIVPYGKTHGQRPLLMLAISSPQNIQQLSEIRQQRQQLTSGNAKDIPEDTKLIMVMGYGVHGDEASAQNSAPLVAYHLVSGQSDSLSDTLDQCIFFIDPSLNPDGSDRFANWVNENRGRFASDDPADREHRQPWPGGRSNYYWFDLNRDWLPLAHPESQGRLTWFHQWKPHVVLDYHEMGAGSTYFFQPGEPARNNPLSPSGNLQLTREFAKSYIQVMDQAGELYFTEEVFDDFYVGKGSTYPDLNGAIGILFEQGSTRGLRVKTGNIERHFADSIANQLRTSLASIERIIELKQPLLDYQFDFFNNSLQAGQRSETTAYILSGTPSRIRAAKDLMDLHGIHSYINHQTIRIESDSFAALEALVIPSPQPQHTLLESLMQQEQNFKENIFYDVSAWHLPSAFDLEVHRLTSDVPQQWLEGHSSLPPHATTIDWDQLDLETVVGFAFSPVELDSAQWVSALMQLDIEVRISMLPFDESNQNREDIDQADSAQDLPAGTYLVLKAGNKQNWNKVLRKIRQLDGNSSVRPVVLTTSRNPAGPDLGSGRIAVLPQANPALVVGTGTSSTTAGAIWHFLDHRMQQPATLLNTDTVGQVDLNKYSCIILPPGAYSSWDRREANALSQYARQGGTIIGIGSAINWLNRNNITTASAGLADDSFGQTYDGPLPPTRNENPTSAPARTRGETRQPDADAPTEPQRRIRFADAREASALESIAGAFFMAEIDSTHPLGFGFPDEYVPIFRDSTVVYPNPSNPLQVVAKYQDVIAGYVSDRNRGRLKNQPAVWAQNVGRGRIVFLADNPVFRGYVRSSERFLSNAILVGPVLRIPSAPRD